MAYYPQHYGPLFILYSLSVLRLLHYMGLFHRIIQNFMDPITPQTEETTVGPVASETVQAEVAQPEIVSDAPQAEVVAEPVAEVAPEVAPEVVAEVVPTEPEIIAITPEPATVPTELITQEMRDAGVDETTILKTRDELVAELGEEKVVQLESLAVPAIVEAAVVEAVLANPDREDMGKVFTQNGKTYVRTTDAYGHIVDTQISSEYGTASK